jgi:hypothetical protein
MIAGISSLVSWMIQLTILSSPLFFFFFCSVERNMQNNNFSGSIPESFGGLQNLEHLVCKTRTIPCHAKSQAFTPVPIVAKTECAEQ